MSLAVRGLTKRYGGITVLDRVDLTVEDGEIHALLGANGAGKSTLIKCISGAVTPDGGEIDLSGKVFRSLTPRQAMSAGVAVIYQELSVINTLNVADNIYLGDEMTKGPFLQRRAGKREAQAWLNRLGVDFNPGTELSGLSSADLQVVEIVKALHREPSVLILDEPTAALSEAEVKRLGQHMRTLRSQGLPLLFITHRLAEVFEFADRVTVLRGGRVVLSCSVHQTDRHALVEAITKVEHPAGGRASAAAAQASASVGDEGTARLQVHDLLGPGIGPIDLDVQARETVGVFGLVGSGRTELVETIFGARKRRSGTVSVDGRGVRMKDSADAVAAGVALIPSDRMRKSLFIDIRADENVLFPSYGRLSRRGMWRDRRGERKLFKEGADQINLDPPVASQVARRFSGGNQQKLVLERWLQLGEACSVMLLDEPTQGVDVGARGELYAAIRGFAEGGGAIVFTSSEADELLQVADRIVVLARGKVVCEYERGAVTESELVEAAHFGETSEGPDSHEMATSHAVTDHEGEADR